MDNIELIQTAGALVTALVSLVLFVLKRNKSEFAFPKTFRGKLLIQGRQDQLYNAFNKYLKRIITIGAENGGGMPVMGNRINISVMFESCDLNQDSGLINDWQERVMDAEYYLMLSRMIEASLNDKNSPYYAFNTSSLDNNSILRTTLEAQHVKSCRVYYVGQIYFKLFGLIKVVPKRMIYIGLNQSCEFENINDPSYDSACANYIEFLRKQLL